MSEIQVLESRWQSAQKRHSRTEIKNIREELLQGRMCTIHALESLTGKRLTASQQNMRAGQVLRNVPDIGGDIRNFHRIIERIASQPHTDAGKVLANKNFHWERLTSGQIEKRLKKGNEQFILADESEEHAHHLDYATGHHWFSDSYHRELYLGGYKKYVVVVFTDKQ